MPGAGVTISTAPRTIHDFGGFPRELYQVQYPASVDPDLARRVRQMLAPLPVTFEHSWRLDHGTWSVLRHAYPAAGTRSTISPLRVGTASAGPYDRALQFETEAKQMMLAGEYKPLIEYEKLGREAMLSIPTPDHYRPLPYVIATRLQGEAVTFPIQAVEGGSISMLTVQVGDAA